MRRLVIVCALLLAIGSTANAAGVWVSGAVGDWSNAANWDSLPVSSTTVVIDNGAATLDASQTVAILRLGATAGQTATLNINSGSNLTTYKSGSGELFRVAGAGTGVVNHSAGTVAVYNGAGTGEVRLSNATTGTATYNLSGTGVLDVEYLNKGDKARPAAFNATGGTLLVRNYINKFGLVSESATYGFRLGGATLEVAGYADRNNQVGNVLLGQGQNMDFIMDSTSKVKFDLGSAAGTAGTNWDLLSSRGNFTIDGELMVNFLVAPTVGDHWDVWTMQAGYFNTYNGSGTFDVLPSNIQASWVDTGTGTDTLRLTYVPEPATLLMLGLGGLISLKRHRI
jgi:hypothetical protein